MLPSGNQKRRAMIGAAVEHTKLLIGRDRWRHCAGPVIERLERRCLLAGDGLAATYYDNINFTGITLNRTDPQVRFNWGLGSPSATIKPNTFSVRWTGQVEALTTETYTFYTRADDGVKLWVNGVQLVSNWTDQVATERKGQIALQAGQRYDIVMEYYENTGDAVAQLRWSTPTIAKQFIPQTQLYSGAAEAVVSQPAPSGFAANAVGGTQVALSWSDTVTGETSYLLERSTAAGAFVSVATLPAGSTSYLDSVADNGSYTYRLRATGIAMAPAASVTVSVPLAAPSNLVATPAVSAPTITLAWADNSQSETGYLVERSTDGITFIGLATLPANSASYADSTPHAGAQYTYRVSATAGSTSSTGVLATATAMAATAPATPAGTVATTLPEFPVFDALLFSGKPDLTAAGMTKIYVAYQWEFTGGDGSLPDEAGARAAARRAADAGQIMVIDIEDWPMDIRAATDAEVQSGIERFTQVIGWLRNERPGLQLGIYSVLPTVSHASTYNGDPSAILAWQTANDRLAALASQVDYVFPSLYTNTDDPSAWYRRAMSTVEEARRFGKPVYPFVWMYYHDTMPVIGETPLPVDYWRMQLETLRQAADGIVVWGGFRQPWDNSAPWWLATKSYLDATPTALAPAAPAALSATGQIGSTHLQWQDNSFDEAGFNIERSADGILFDQIATVAANSTTYTDARVNGEMYYYRVRATNWITESSPSNVAMAQSLKSGFGSTLQAESYNDQSGVGITSTFIGALDGGNWVKYANVSFSSAPSVFVANLAVPASNAGQSIEVRLDSPSGTLAGVLRPANTGGWSTFVPQSTSVTGIRGTHDIYLTFSGGSGIANIDWIAFDVGPILPAPTNVSAEYTGNGQTRLTWSHPSGGVAQFRIERAVNGGGFKQIGMTEVGTLAYVDELAVAGTVSYRVRANTLASGDSAYSNTATVLAARDAHVAIQAESFDAWASPVGSGTFVSGLNGGNWLKYANVDFGTEAVTSLAANLAVPDGNAGQSIELRLDGSAGPLIGTLVPASTGSWSTFGTQIAAVSSAAGVHDLYLVFKGGSGVANLDWFVFA